MHCDLSTVSAAELININEDLNKIDSKGRHVRLGDSKPLNLGSLSLQKNQPVPSKCKIRTPRSIWLDELFGVGAKLFLTNVFMNTLVLFRR